MATANVVGLDVGSTSIRAVGVTEHRNRPVITEYGKIPLGTGAVIGGVVKDRRAVSSALRQLWSQHAFGTKDVTLGVTHQQVIVREIDIPNLTKRELRRALPHLVRDVLPLPPDQAVLDFFPLEQPGKSPTVHGLLIAAPKEAVMDMISAVEGSGLRVAHVDLSCFAALRAAAHLAGDTEALVDIGATGTNIVFHTAGVPNIVRSIPRGGNEITSLVATRLSVTTQEAEKTKRRVGLTHEAERADVDAAEAIAEGIRPLVTEIRTSLGYFAQVNPERQVKRLALVGGASMLSGLPAALTRELGVPAYLSDPLQRVGSGSGNPGQDKLERQRSSAAVAIGLTLGAA